MNAALLLEHYARIADAPDAIARLRRFVLDLAVRGKLVEQDADDEPASVVAMRIASAKAVQEKTGEMRRRKPLPPISQSEYPYEPPLGWIWERLGRGANITQGFAFASSDFSKSPADGYPLIKIGDIGGDQPDTYIKGKPDLSYLVQPGELLLGLSGSIKCAVWQGPEALLNQRIAKILPPSNEIFSPWLHLAVHSCIEKWKAETSKLTVQNIKADQLYNSLIPLPPVAEQHRIVAKVEELMALCDQLEAARVSCEAARDMFTLSTLAKLNTPDPETFGQDARFALANLASLTTRPDQIKQLRQTILNLAVRGKLVAQDAADENALNLKTRIATARAERAKAAGIRAKRPITFSGEAAMEQLPENWTYEVLGNLVDPCATISYGVLVPGPDCDDGIPFVRAQDLSLTGHAPRPNKTISPEIEAPYARTRLKGGEILLCVVGSIGKLGIVPASWAGANIARAVARISPVDLISSPYLLLTMRSEWVQQRFSDATRTLAQPTLNVGLIEAVPIPIPPLAEQHRIVAKVDELMALCDGLEASITTGEQTRSRLLEAVLHNALEPA